MTLQRIIQWLLPWLLDNVLWVALVFVSGLIIAIRSAVSTARRLLHQNRDTRDNGWGAYLADRFLDVWFSSPKLPLRTESSRYVKAFHQSRWNIDVIDRKLCGLALVEIKPNDRGVMSVFAVHSLRNRIVARICKEWLVLIIGDNRKCYEDMRHQAAQHDKQ